MRQAVIILSLVVISTNLLSQVPELTIIDINQDTFLLSDIMEDSTSYVISFWANWCGPCIQEYNALAKGDYPNKWSQDYNTDFLAIAIGSARHLERSKERWLDEDWQGTAYFSSGDDVIDQFDVRAIPQTFIFREGEQVYHHTGYDPGDEIILDQFITGNMTTSTTDLDESQKPNIYFFYDDLNVQVVDGSSLESIRVYNMNGQLLLNETITSKNATIFTRKLNNQVSQLPLIISVKSSDWLYTDLIINTTR